MITGVTLPTSGTARVDGFDVVKQKSQASEKIGWVPEFPNFDQNAKAKSLMHYFAGFHGVNSDQADRRIGNLFEDLKLSGFENKKLRTFSQGMKKRFTLALAMLPNPNNFLFDELLNGLDPEGIHFMRTLIVNFKDQHKAVLLSSHMLSEVENMCDRVVFIHKGKMIKEATRTEIAEIGRAEGIVKIVFGNMSDEALEYLGRFGTVKDIDKDSIRIINFSGDTAELNYELTKRGFLVREISYERSGLEQYFLSLVETQTS